MENYKDKNINRTRYYGLRVGDIVTIKLFSGNTNKFEDVEVEVVGYSGFDNNSVYVKDNKDGIEMKWVAEWCKLITKVEDRKEDRKIV